MIRRTFRRIGIATGVGVTFLFGTNYYLNKHVETISVPSGSCLDRGNDENTYKDAFQVKIPRSTLRYSSAAQREGIVVPFARTFFSSPLFKIERKIRAPQLTDRAIRSFEFRVGESLGSICQVKESRRDELLFEWKLRGGAKQGGMDGYSWLAVKGDDQYVYFRFGSSCWPAKSLNPLSVMLHVFYSKCLVYSGARGMKK